MVEPVARTAVIGLGNVLMSDEGAGVRALEALEPGSLPEGVELFDGGTAFHVLIGELEGFDRWVIVDAVRGDGPPGTIYRLDLDEIARDNAADGSYLSVHDLGVRQVVRWAHLIHRTPDDIVLIGVEPARITPSMDLSPTLQRRLPALAQAVLNELQVRAACEPWTRRK